LRGIASADILLYRCAQTLPDEQALFTNVEERAVISGGCRRHLQDMMLHEEGLTTSWSTSCG
jgi:hypothetical protein